MSSLTTDARQVRSDLLPFPTLFVRSLTDQESDPPFPAAVAVLQRIGSWEQGSVRTAHDRWQCVQRCVHTLPTQMESDPWPVQPVQTLVPSDRSCARLVLAPSPWVQRVVPPAGSLLQRHETGRRSDDAVCASADARAAVGQALGIRVPGLRRCKHRREAARWSVTRPISSKYWSDE